MLWTTIAVTLGAFLLNLLLTPLILRLAHRFGWMDSPNERSIHKDPVPRLGGFGILVSFFVCVSTLYFWDSWDAQVLPANAQNQTTFLVTLGLLSTFVLGLLDDFVQFRAVFKFLLQLLGAFLAIGAGLVVTTISVPFTDIVFDLGSFGPFLTLLWIVGVTNAVNLIDGMDGLAGGFSLLAFLFLGIAMALTGHPLAAIVSFAIVGALAGFLVFNIPPAKIFMGDAGSLSLGYMMAVLALWGGPQDSLFHKLWLLPFTIVLVPVADTVSAILRRIRQGRPIWAPDKEHTHHKLLRLGFSTKAVLAMVYSTFIVTASPVLIMAAFPEATHGNNLLQFLSIGSIVLIIAAFAVLHFTYRKKYPDPVQPARSRE